MATSSREALEKLGTTFVNLGQILSSRPDLLPDVFYLIWKILRTPGEI